MFMKYKTKFKKTKDKSSGALQLLVVLQNLFQLKQEIIAFLHFPQSGYSWDCEEKSNSDQQLTQNCTRDRNRITLAERKTFTKMDSLAWYRAAIPLESRNQYLERVTKFNWLDALEVQRLVRWFRTSDSQCAVRRHGEKSRERGRELVATQIWSRPSDLF